MLLPFKKKEKIDTAALAASAKAAAQQASNLFVTPTSEFLPYYCHYNPTTLLTKNGELMQVVRILTNVEGLNYESGNDKQHIVREVIREAIGEHVQSEGIAFWMHTIRKRQFIRYRGKYRETLAGKVHDRWQQINRWKYQYYNEIYLSFVYVGQSASMMDTNHLREFIFPQMNRNYRNRYLEDAETKLTDMVDKVMAHIRKSFVAERLTIVERMPDSESLKTDQALFFSEPMEFIGTLLNLRTEQMLLPLQDLSEALISTRHTFGFNALETKADNGKRRFSSILSLKQYREVPSETIDRFLQAPMEFVVSESFNFVPPEGALRQYREQREIFEVSGDLYCIEAAGIADMIASHKGKTTDYGEHQVTIMVMCDELKQLDGEVVKVQNAFAELGLITIREDIKLEECFWSQLPANFEFLRRKDPINTARVGGFCRLNRYPQGNYTGNHWGDAVTIFPTLVGSPYFFNFHHEDNGHTLLLDFNTFNDQTAPILLNFLLAQSRKFDGRIVVFDRHFSCDLMFEKFEAPYHHFSTLRKDPEHPPIRLNPFLMDDTPRNRSFILAWLGMMVAPDVALPDGQKAELREAIAAVYELPANKRKLSVLVTLLEDKDPPLAKGFEKWIAEGVYAGIFDTFEETVDFKGAMTAFDFETLSRRKETVLPVFSYLLHRIVTAIDGKPTIIVMHEAFDLLDNHFIAPRIESLMQMLRDNNVMLLMTTAHPARHFESAVYHSVFKECATHLYLPDDVSHDYASMPVGLNEYDGRRLLRMERQKGDFMIRQNKESIGLRADLKYLDELHAIFANDRKNLAGSLGNSADGTLSG